MTLCTPKGLGFRGVGFRVLGFRGLGFRVWGKPEDTPFRMRPCMIIEGLSQDTWRLEL